MVEVVAMVVMVVTDFLKDLFLLNPLRLIIMIMLATPMLEMGGMGGGGLWQEMVTAELFSIKDL